MPIVLPFRAVRPCREDESLATRLSPPYDVIAPAERARLAALPHNPVHLILPQDDAGEGSRYAAAGRALAGWLADGVLVRDSAPAFYAYEQKFTHRGEQLTRRGFFGLLELGDFGHHVGVFAHERTLATPKEDRYRLLEATHANLSPVFALYDDPTGAVRTALEAARSRPPLAHAVTAEGEEALWAVPDDGGTTPEGACMAVGVQRIVEALAAQGVVLADGHHRYESALRYRHAHRAAQPDAPFPQAYDFMLACFVEAGDPGLLVLPTHRVVHGLPPIDAAALAARLPAGLVRVVALGAPADPDDGARRAEAFLEEHPTGAFVLSTPGSRALDGLVLDPAAAARELAAEGVPVVAHVLDVVQLHELLLGRALGITREMLAAQSHVEYVKSASEILRRVWGEEREEGAVAGAAGRLPPTAGFLMNATPVRQVLEVARAGERMPQKSTYFLPKITTGWAYHVHRAPAEVWGAGAHGRPWWPAD
jgi:uncharacterized protein (DUF1015 family)